MTLRGLTKHVIPQSHVVKWVRYSHTVHFHHSDEEVSRVTLNYDVRPYFVISPNDGGVLRRNWIGAVDVFVIWYRKTDGIECNAKIMVQSKGETDRGCNKRGS